MKSLDELFGDEKGIGEWKDTVSAALGLASNELGILDVDKLRALFDALPEPVRHVAYE